MQAAEIPFYLSPALARENLTASRILNAARRIQRDRARRQTADFEAAIGELQRVGYGADAARELAHFHVYGVHP